MGIKGTSSSAAAMADDEERAAELKKKRTFRKFTFRGIDLDAMLDLTHDQLMDVLHARARRCFNRGLLLRRPVKQLKKKLLKAKKDCGPYAKARRREDPSAKHAHHPRDDRLGNRRAQRKGLHLCGGEGRHGGPLPRRVLHLLQAR